MNDKPGNAPGGPASLSATELLDLTFVGFTDVDQAPTHVALDFRPMVPLLGLPEDFPAVVYMAIDGNPIEATPVDGIAWRTIWTLSDDEVRFLEPHLGAFLETLLDEGITHPNHSVH